MFVLFLLSSGIDITTTDVLWSLSRPASIDVNNTTSVFIDRRTTRTTRLPRLHGYQSLRPHDSSSMLS